MKRLALLVIAVSLGSLGCGGGDGGENPPVDSKAQEEVGVEDVAAGDIAAGDASTDTSTPTGSCPNLPNLTGKVYRVINIEATEPTDQVNEVWQNDIGTYDLVIIFNIKSHDQEADTAVIEVTSGIAEKEKDGDGWKLVSFQYALEPWVFDVTLDGCKFTWTVPIELNIQTPTVSKPFHIFGIKGSGQFTEDGKKILNTLLEGAILETESFDLCLMFTGLGIVNFHWFMNMASLCPTFDSDGDGTIDSYKFKGEIEAIDETSLFREGLTPIVSQVKECKVDDKECVE